jgi:hypothetical protein
MDSEQGRIAINDLFIFSRHALRQALRRRGLMTIVQSWLPLALSMPFVLATWIGFVDRHRCVVSQDNGTYATVATGNIDPAISCFDATFVDLEIALCEAALAVEAAARARWVRIELALGASMTVPVDPRTLRTALLDTMLSAINAAPGGQVLVTATTLGSQLHIRITDDSPETDQPGREIALRQTESLIALQGGSIVVEVRTGRGTTVTIRLPVPAIIEQAASDATQRPVLADQAA